MPDLRSELIDIPDTGTGLSSNDRWSLGDSEMASRIRSFDWSNTSIGAISSWPVSLKAVVAALLHSRHPMFLWWGPELTQLYNDAYVPSFGEGKHPAALGQRAKECWPEIWPIIGPQIEAVMRDGVATWHEDALVPIFRNGSIEQVYWTYGYSPVFDDEGGIAGTLVVCTETTARVEAEAELRKQRERLEQFLQQIPAGVCIFRGDELRFDFANSQYEHFVGRDHLLGNTLLGAMPELQGQGFDDLLLGVMHTGEPVTQHEVRAKHDREGPGITGENFYTFGYSPFRSIRGVVDGVIAVVLDVTEHVLAKRKAEQLARQLRESEDQFRVLVETIPQLVWGARPDGHIDWYNERWYAYTGTTLESMEGWGWKSVHDPKLVDGVVQAWSQALSTGETFEMQFPLRRHDGVFRWHLTRAVPLRDDDGRITRWIGTNTDIHDSRQAELERAELHESERAARLFAEASSRAKDDFLATASHELRTPLNAILGWARMLRAGHVEDRDQGRALDSIQRNAEAQVRLIDDILDGSRISTGKLQLAIGAVDMVALVRTALDTVRASADAKQIQLRLSIDETVGPLASGDSDRLQQVVWNLVSNAIKFTPKGGAVQVSLRRVDGDFELTVADTGQGIAPEFLPYVFERFRQAESGASRRHQGLGLGLALVRYLVEAHGGSVRVSSPGISQGARFTATIPVVAAMPTRQLREPPSPLAAAAAAHEKPLATLAGVAILVVDDEADARDLVAVVLQGRGAAVTTAGSALAALELLVQHSYRVVVSDIGMPDVDGLQLVRRIRALTGDASSIPVVAVTAYAREEDRRMALAAGFNAHVAKPVDPNELSRVVGELATPLPVKG